RNAWRGVESDGGPNFLGICSTRFENGLPAYGLADGLIGVDASACGSSDDGADGGEQVGAPVGTEAAGDLAIGCGGAQFPFASVVVGCHLGIVEEGEQVIANLAVSPAQSLTVP